MRCWVGYRMMTSCVKWLTSSRVLNPCSGWRR
jgi:hypothetical protein